MAAVAGLRRRRDLWLEEREKKKKEIKRKKRNERERERERISLLKRKYSEKIKIKNIFYVEAVLSCQLRRFFMLASIG